MTRTDTLPQPPHPTLIAPAPLKAVRLFITKNGAPPRHAVSTRSVASTIDDENKENVERMRVELMRSLSGMTQKGVETEEGGEKDTHNTGYLGVADGWPADPTHADSAAYAELLEIISRTAQLPAHYDSSSPRRLLSRQPSPTAPRLNPPPRPRSSLDAGTEMYRNRKRMASGKTRDDNEKEVLGLAQKDVEEFEKKKDVWYMGCEELQEEETDDDESADMEENGYDFDTVFLSPGLPTPVMSVSPILRTQNPMPLNAPFTQLPSSINQNHLSGNFHPLKGFGLLPHHDGDASARAGWNTAMMQVLAITRMRSLSVGDRPFGYVF
ncbi:hypothetical protein BC937DRAFT_93028 [Endogone sp. FLAS-F59071]|nr:hypothetical protein BC937DRAFT_93028 [Endogone sp. FLAS-F59071]|eukprot:RUS21323.1 hypothetical protein BC937DRAFT_93028 [Endogone sp. FLAS-F59071]